VGVGGSGQPQHACQYEQAKTQCARKQKSTLFTRYSYDRLHGQEAHLAHDAPPSAMPVFY
jgi:hypothetical protein